LLNVKPWDVGTEIPNMVAKCKLMGFGNLDPPTCITKKCDFKKGST
jgi:hypothetical protein